MKGNHIENIAVMEKKYVYLMCVTSDTEKNINNYIAEWHWMKWQI